MIPDEVWVIFYSDGVLKYKDIVSDCKNDKWSPVLTCIRNDKKIIPYFLSIKKAAQFAKKNIGTKSVWGTISLPEEEFKELQQNHETELFYFPHLIDSSTMDTHIHYFKAPVDVTLQKGR